MNKIFGYIDQSDNFIETGSSERGAKVAGKKVLGADSNQLQVGYRSPINNMYIATSSWCNCMEKWLTVVYL